MRRVRGWPGMLALLVLVVTLLPPRPAAACSCAEPELDEILEREPDAVAARVRRIDPEGGSTGVVRVEEVLHGVDLPEQLAVSLDDGASCRPWVAVGAWAVLTFVPAGDGWETLACGRMPLTMGRDLAVVPDPGASGDPALVVASTFPDAQLVALDDHLRVLSVARGVGDLHALERCGDGLAGWGRGPAGETVVVSIDPTDLEVVAERSLAAAEASEVVDIACDATDRVDVVTQAYDDSRSLHLHTDVFGAHEQLPLPSGADAVVVDDGVLLLRPADLDEAGLTLARYDVTTGVSEQLLELDDVRGHELWVAPGQAQAAVLGFADDPTLLMVELATGHVTARAAGWWQPVAQPWMGPDRLLQRDEAASAIGGTGLGRFRLVGPDLTPVATFPPMPGWNAAGDAGSVVVMGGNGIAVFDGDGQLLRRLSEPWASATHEAVVLGSIEEHADAGFPPLPSVDPTLVETAVDRGYVEVAGWDPSRSTERITAAIGGGAVACGVLAVALRRCRQRVRNDDLSA